MIRGHPQDSLLVGLAHIIEAGFVLVEKWGSFGTLRFIRPEPLKDADDYQQVLRAISEYHMKTIGQSGM